MRTSFIVLTLLTGTVAAISGAQAAPRSVEHRPSVSGAPLLQTVQYYDYGRHRAWREHEERERFRRHAEWRHERHERHEAREHEHRGW